VAALFFCLIKLFDELFQLIEFIRPHVLELDAKRLLVQPRIFPSWMTRVIRPRKEGVPSISCEFSKNSASIRTGTRRCFRRSMGSSPGLRSLKNTPVEPNIIRCLTPSSQTVDFRRPLADSFKPATIEGMRASSDSTALVTVDPRRRIMRSVREGLVKLHGALIIAEQQTYERLNGPVPSVEALIDLLQKDPWFTWLHPIADVLVRMDHLLDDDTTDITDDNVAHLMGEVDALLHPSVQGEGFERAYYEALDRAPDVVLAHFQVRKLLPKAA
jgi:hypothetical protein